LKQSVVARNSAKAEFRAVTHGMWGVVGGNSSTRIEGFQVSTGTIILWQQICNIYCPQPSPTL